jgi:membrane dipeptidase
VVDEMNRVSMMVDVSHCGYRTSMDAIKRSSAPVIFSHPAIRGAGSTTGTSAMTRPAPARPPAGVIGINALGIFLRDCRARRADRRAAPLAA